jgi:hypothetical protein
MTVFNAVMGEKLDTTKIAHCREERTKQVAAVDNAIRFAKAGMKCFEAKRADFAARHAIHYAQAWRRECVALELGPHPQGLQGPDAIRPKLEASASLIENRRLFKHAASKALAGKRNGDGKASDSATNNGDLHMGDGSAASPQLSTGQQELALRRQGAVD